MKTKNKVLLLSLCAVLLVVATALGTMAYLTDQETVTNTFTVGSVSLGDGELESGLDEAKVDEYGVPVEDADRVTENTYKLIPGHTYVKDPTVHINYVSEDSYIFVKIENGITDIEAASATGGYQNIEAQVIANGWLPLADVENVYYKVWNNPGELDEGTYDLVVFEEFMIGGDVPAEDLAGYIEETIVVTAYAIQMDGFASASEAWTAGAFE